MKVAKISIYITIPLTVISLITAIAFHFICSIDEFWSNVLLGVFGSGLLTAITSIITYNNERKRVFEGFYDSVKAIVHELNKYQRDWDLDKKIDFFVMYSGISYIDFDRYFASFFLSSRL